MISSKQYGDTTVTLYEGDKELLIELSNPYVGAMVVGIEAQMVDQLSQQLRKGALEVLHLADTEVSQGGA